MTPDYLVYHVLLRYSTSSSVLLREETILIARQALVTNSMPKNKTAQEDFCKTINSRILFNVFRHNNEIQRAHFTNKKTLRLY